MARRNKRREPPLSPEERELLAEFERRRAGFEAALEASNIVHHRHTCPACGFPSLNDEDRYPVCIICQWEPYGGASLSQDRLRAARMIREFERSYALDGTIDDMVRAIKTFEARCMASKINIIEDDFTAHLRHVVPTRPRRA